MEVEGKKRYSRQLHSGLILLCITIIVLVGVWSYTSPMVASSADSYMPQLFHQGWSQQIGDQLVPLEDIQDYTPVEAGESLVFTCTLPEVTDGWALLFYSDNKEVCVYVADVLIQDFTMAEGFTILKTAGSAWCQVDLTSDMSGKTCTLIFNSPLGAYEFLGDIYFVESQNVDGIRFMDLWPAVLAAFGVFVIMVVLVAAGLVGRRQYQRQYLFSIVLYFLAVLLWLLAELNFYDMFFGRPIMSYLLGAVFMRMIPVALLFLAKNSTNKYWHPQIFRGISLLAWANLLVSLLLQFVFGISLLETTVLHCLVSALVGVFLLAIICEKLLHLKELDYEEYPCLMLPILIICGGVDNVILCLHNVYYPFLGVWSAIGCIVFAIATLIVLTYINSRVAQERTELKQSCEVLENTALIKQIEAHFIFNTLNTVSAFCKTDPVKADETVTYFSSYLRTYLCLVNCHDNIPIEQELKFVENYLILQQIRFDDRVKYSIEADVLDFEVPPLTVHTLVENAIIHGICMQNQGGTVTITTKKSGDVIQVIVTDTGVGFDTNASNETASVGLQNIERRLKIMVNGTLTISSSIGVGTTSIIAIPYKCPK